MTVDVAIAVAIPLATLAVGVWCGIRLERHRRDRELDDLFDEHGT